MLDKLKTLITIPNNPISEFLSIKWIDTKFFIFDNWMIVHFCSGLLLAKFFKDPWKVFGLLVLYEILEYMLWGISFKQESIINIALDLIFGMSGFKIMRKIEDG
jgi:hypothetical protein